MGSGSPSPSDRDPEGGHSGPWCRSRSHVEQNNLSESCWKLRIRILSPMKRLRWCSHSRFPRAGRGIRMCRNRCRPDAELVEDRTRTMWIRRGGLSLPGMEAGSNESHDPVATRHFLGDARRSDARTWIHCGLKALRHIARSACVPAVVCLDAGSHGADYGAGDGCQQ